MVVLINFVGLINAWNTEHLKQSYVDFSGITNELSVVSYVGYNEMYVNVK
jgi:hypothetical protein